MLCDENCSGVKSADGRISSADERERLGRVLAVHAVEVAPDERQERQRDDARLFGAVDTLLESTLTILSH